MCFSASIDQRKVLRVTSFLEHVDADLLVPVLHSMRIFKVVLSGYTTEVALYGLVETISRSRTCAARLPLKDSLYVAISRLHGMSFGRSTYRD